LLLHFHTSSAQLATLTVQIDNLPVDQGDVLVAIYSSSETFLSDDLVQGSTVSCMRESCQAVFEEVPFGSYAISAFFDENRNGELDKNWFGMPKEAFGFSNNPTLRFGPPSFNEAKVVIEQEKQLVVILF